MKCQDSERYLTLLLKMTESSNNFQSVIMYSFVHLVDDPRQLVLVEDGEYVRRAFGAEDKLELVDTLVSIHVEGAEDRGSEVTRVHLDSGAVISSHLENRLQRKGTTRLALSHCQPCSR